MQEINIIGIGYVGFTLALHMSLQKVRVYATDNNDKTINSLKNGISHIHESTIKESLKESLLLNNISFSNHIEKDTGNYVIAISYYPNQQKQFLNAITDLFPASRSNYIKPLIMIRGTIPAGYISEYLVPGLESHFKGALDEVFYLVSAPERSLSGNAIEELSELPQIIGGSELSLSKAKKVFKYADIEVISMPSYEASELVKSFTNYARLVQFNLANYLSVLASIANVNENTLFNAIKHNYPRMDFLNSPGNGVGGFCLPKDSLVLHDSLSGNKDISVYESIKTFPLQQYKLNEDIIKYHGDQVASLLHAESKVLALGIAFKGEPETDDIRDSVGIKIIDNIINKGFNLDVYDISIDRMSILDLGYNVFKSDSLDNYNVILILNNNKKYIEFLNTLNANSSDSMQKFILYDPWRILASDDQSAIIGQYQFNL